MIAFDFYTQYNQFYIADKLHTDTEDRNFWSTDAYNERLAMSEGMVGIGTECYGPVKGEIALLDSANDNFNNADFDHIVEGALQIDSGYMLILDCPTSTIQHEIKINSGAYRVRVFSSNLASVEGDEGDDYYRIEIWPGTNLDRKVIKHYGN